MTVFGKDPHFPCDPTNMHPMGSHIRVCRAGHLSWMRGSSMYWRRRPQACPWGCQERARWLEEVEQAYAVLGSAAAMELARGMARDGLL